MIRPKGPNQVLLFERYKDHKALGAHGSTKEFKAMLYVEVCDRRGDADKEIAKVLHRISRLSRRSCRNSWKLTGRSWVMWLALGREQLRRSCDATLDKV